MPPFKDEAALVQLAPPKTSDLFFRKPRRPSVKNRRTRPTVAQMHKPPQYHCEYPSYSGLAEH